MVTCVALSVTASDFIRLPLKGLLKYIRADISANSSVSPHLFHETLAQSHDLGKQDGVVGQVRAQVAQHVEDVPGQMVKAFGRPQCLFVPQRHHQTAFGTFGDCSPKNTGRSKSSTHSSAV